MSLSDPVGRLRQRKHVRKFDNSENVAYLSYDALADKNQHSFVILRNRTRYRYTLPKTSKLRRATILTYVNRFRQFGRHVCC